MHITLIRHGKTYGNEKGVYLGSTDEQLAPEYMHIAGSKRYPAAELVFSSPMKRCLMTAEIIYPGVIPVVLDDLREFDFGVFEGKTYKELKDDPAYIKWVETRGSGLVPGGEDGAGFSRRCRGAFEEIIRMSYEQSAEKVCVICHGGTIMAILDIFSSPHKDFYEWQVKNLEGFSFRWDLFNFKAVDILKFTGV